jgi:hypothetical protein
MQSDKIASKKSKRKQLSSPTTSRWFWGNVFNLFRRFGSTIIWATVVAFIFHLAANVLIAYVGHELKADLAVRIAANLNVAFGLSVSTTLITSYLYTREFKRHRETRERLSARAAALERQIDANRTSSRLTSQGMTQTEDL